MSTCTDDILVIKIFSSLYNLINLDEEPSNILLTASSVFFFRSRDFRRMQHSISTRTAPTNNEPRTMRTILNRPCTTLFFDPPQGFKTLAPIQEESLVLQEIQRPGFPLKEFGVELRNFRRLSGTGPLNWL